MLMRPVHARAHMSCHFSKSSAALVSPVAALCCCLVLNSRRCRMAQENVNLCVCNASIGNNALTFCC